MHVILQSFPALLQSSLSMLLLLLDIDADQAVEWLQKSGKMTSIIEEARGYNTSGFVAAATNEKGYDILHKARQYISPIQFVAAMKKVNPKDLTIRETLRVGQLALLEIG